MKVYISDDFFDRIVAALHMHGQIQLANDFILATAKLELLDANNSFHSRTRREKQICKNQLQCELRARGYLASQYPKQAWK